MVALPPKASCQQSKGARHDDWECVKMAVGQNVSHLTLKVLGLRPRFVSWLKETATRNFGSGRKLGLILKVVYCIAGHFRQEFNFVALIKAIF